MGCEVHDIVVGWFVIPSALSVLLGSVVSAAWNHFSGKDLRAVESRLRKQEEVFRVAQSPRVTTAIDLWGALRAYERQWAELLEPIKEIKVPPGSTVPDWPRLSDEAGRALFAKLEELWLLLSVARDRAEVVLPQATFAPFGALFDAYGMAHRTMRFMRRPGLVRESRAELAGDRDQYLAEASKLHEGALAAFQALLGSAEVT